MGDLDVRAEILQRYPEQNMFDSVPPLPTLTPYSLEFFASLDTPEFRAACRDEAARTGFNPLALSYGTNLLALAGPRSSWTDFPFKSYKKPPPLVEAILPKEAVLLEQLNKQGNTLLFTVRVGNETRLLKIVRRIQFPSGHAYKRHTQFANRTTFQLPNYKFMYDHTGPLFVEYDPFEAEKDAYAHLLHHGVCADGIVPHCFGHLQLGRERMDEMLALPNVSEECELELRHRKQPPDALLLQYFPGARQLTQDDATEKLADTAVRALWRIHAAYVQHGDVLPRNILLLPDGRVVLVDFNRARTPCGASPCSKEDLVAELSEMWVMFYKQYVSVPRIALL